MYNLFYFLFNQCFVKVAIHNKGIVKTTVSPGFLASECFGVALSSNQGNSPLRSENTGFHFALTSAKLPALRSVETPTPNPCEVRECSLFLEVTFVISNHRITYNSMLAIASSRITSRCLRLNLLHVSILYLLATIELNNKAMAVMDVIMLLFHPVMITTMKYHVIKNQMNKTLSTAKYSSLFRSHPC